MLVDPVAPPLIPSSAIWDEGEVAMMQHCGGKWGHEREGLNVKIP
jgi:hypothetical protein